MKNLFVFAIAGLIVFAPAVFAGQGHGGHLQTQSQIQQEKTQSLARSFLATGIVKKVDTGNGIVTIYHQPVAALMWPSMTMPFTVSDRALLERFNVGEKVEFEFLKNEQRVIIIGST